MPLTATVPGRKGREPLHARASRPREAAQEAPHAALKTERHVVPLLLDQLKRCVSASVDHKPAESWRKAVIS